MKKYIKENKISIITIGITFLLFLLLSILVVTNKTTYIDTQVHSYILNIRNDNLSNILMFLTNFAGATILLALSVILLIVMKNKKTALYIFINLACAFLTNEVAKTIFDRSRPIGINLVDETGLSYPSGHSMVGLAFYGFIAYLLYENSKNKKHQIAIITFFTITILIIGFTRIYLGVHYLTDVIGGFLLGTIYLITYINIIKKEKK